LVRILLRKETASDLRLVSYLAPSLPEGLFVAVATRIAEATGLTTSLRFETRSSAPPRGEVDPFSSGEADIGFLCSPGYIWMTDLQPPAVRLLAAAPVFDDPRTEGRPVYFSDVVVAHGSPAIGFDDLQGGTWAFNDPCSWSGYLNLLVRLRYVAGAAFFRALRESGSHLQSVRLIATGEVDGAAVDERPRSASAPRTQPCVPPADPGVVGSSSHPAHRGELSHAVGFSGPHRGLAVLHAPRCALCEGPPFIRRPSVRACGRRGICGRARCAPLVAAGAASRRAVHETDTGVRRLVSRAESDGVRRVGDLARSGTVLAAAPSTGPGTIRERRWTQQGSSA